MVFDLLISYSTTLISFFFLFVVAAWGYVRNFRKTIPGLPPGPKPQLIFGNLRAFAKEKGYGRLRVLDEIGKKYGGVYTMYFGSQPKIVVTDYEIIKRILNDDVFSGRPRRFFGDLFFRRFGLLYSDGPLWKEHRPFALKTLRDFGLGKPWLATTVIEETQDLIRDLEETNQRPINPASMISYSAANIICAISFGKRFDHSDQNFRRLALLMSKAMKLSGLNSYTGFFPWLRFIPMLPFRKNYLAYVDCMKDLGEFAQILIDEHKSNFQEGEARDYIDAYLNEQHRQASNPESTFTREQLKMSILTLLGAGVDTTATTTCWSLLFLLENPDLHQKLLKEIDSAIPDGGFPNYEEKSKMPYLEAFIMEVLRLSHPIPVPARRTMEPVEINGYLIPENLTILPNLYSVHMDPKFFPNPKKFDPSRYLDAEGKIKKVEGYLPFTVGKRYCYGESLAKMELFIMVASLVKHFSIRNAPGEKASSADSLLGLVNWPTPFKAIFTPRSGGRRFSITGTGKRLWE